VAALSSPVRLVPNRSELSEPLGTFSVAHLLSTELGFYTLSHDKNQIRIVSITYKYDLQRHTSASRDIFFRPSDVEHVLSVSANYASRTTEIYVYYVFCGESIKNYQRPSQFNCFASNRRRVRDQRGS
jgi:hypothetical protein